MALAEFFIENNNKIIFWDLLRANTVKISYIEKFGVLLKKNEKLTILMLIFSHETVKYQKVSLYITKGLSFAFPENTTAFTYDSYSYIFFDSKN